MHQEPADGRRRFIAKAGLAAGVVWSAPVILSVPASAQGSVVASGLYRAEWDSELLGVTPQNGTGCSPSTWNNLPEYPGVITAADQGEVFEFTLVDPGPCTLLGGRANGVGGGECQDGVLMNGDLTVLFPKQFQSYVEFRLVIDCG